MCIGFLFIIAIIVIAVMGFQVRNSLANAREQVYKSRANIVGGLQKRFDILSGLLTLALHYEKYEREALQTAADNSLHKATKLSSGSARMVITNLDTQYPQLRANEPYQTMMGQLMAVENEVDQLFKAHNEAVVVLNAQLQTFLGRFVGTNVLNFERQEYLDSSMSEKLLPCEVDLAALRVISTAPKTAKT